MQHHLTPLFRMNNNCQVFNIIIQCKAILSILRNVLKDGS